MNRPIRCPHCGMDFRSSEDATIHHDEGREVVGVGAGQLGSGSTESMPSFANTRSRLDSTTPIESDEPERGSDELFLGSLSIGESPIEPDPSVESTRTLNDLVEFVAPGSSPITSDPPALTSKNLAEAGPSQSSGPSQRAPISTILLLSYASALTLAMLWLFWTGRVRPWDNVAQEFPSQRTPAQSDRAALLAELPAIREGRIVQPGGILRIGDLEIRPTSVGHGAIRLVSATGRGREEGDVLTLRLEIRHTGRSGPFAPLEPKFVRVLDQGVPESLIAADGQAILPYPLALESEWTIVGESFQPLEPGDTRSVLLASESGVGSRLAPEMTWYFRLRVAEDRTEWIGIRFRRDELTP